MVKVNLERCLEYTELKSHLLEEAKKFEWEARIKEDDRGRFQFCYKGQLIILVNVPFLDYTDIFYVHRGIAPEEQVNEYIKNVHDSLNNAKKSRKLCG